MSRSRYSQRLVPPMGINDDLALQDTIGDHEPSRNPAPAPGPVTTSHPSLPPGSISWLRGSTGSDYTVLESSQDLSTGEGQKKGDQDVPFVSVDFRGLRSDTDISMFEGVQSPPGGEAPKIAIKRGFRANWIKVAPHIVAVCVTAAVCQLSFRNTYWMDLKSPNERVAPGLTQGGALNFLQLAAKLHELLILASISSIVLHAAQAHLTGPSGLPLGMMANAFELGSGQFLVRRSFWSLFWSTDPATGKRFPFIRFWLLSLFSTVLVTLSGPSSAIAVIPTLNYFELPQPFHQIVLPYYVFNKSTELWPTQLTAASLSAPNSGILCNDITADKDICPAGGFRDTYNWAASLLFGDSDKGTNISFPDATADTHRVLMTQSCNSTFDGRASGVSINGFINSAMTAYWIFAQKNFQGRALESAQPHINIDFRTEIFAPRVETMCDSYPNYDFDPENPNDQPSMTFPAFDGSSPIPVPDWTYKYTRSLNASNFTFVEMLSTEPHSPSLGAVLTLPLIENINGTWVQTTENLACSIYSQWIPIDAWYEPTKDDYVSYSITTGMSNTCLTVPTDGSSGRQPINTTIDLDYANAINQPISFLTGAIPALEAIYQRFIFNESTYIPDGVIFKSPIPGIAGAVVTDEDARRQRAKLVSTVLAGVVTDGLARNAGNGAFPYSASTFLLPNRTADGLLQGRFPVTSATGGEDDPLNTTNAADAARWLRLNPTFERYGYGYRWHGSRTAQFGISVLLIHVVAAIMHTILVLTDVLGHDGGIQRAWETIPELFALAVNSRPSERLRNTCAGIGEERTYGEAVAVRETSEGHLEIIVGQNEIQHLARARAGVRYGAFPESNSGAGGSAATAPW